MLRSIRLSSLVFSFTISLLLSASTTAPVTAQRDLPAGLPSDSTRPSPATNPNISFRRPLRIVDIFTPNDLERRRSEYHFTLEFPTEAVEPLQKLVFQQISGTDYPRYRDRRNRAFDRNSRTPLPLSAVENNPEQRSIVVEFDPPVEPGRTVTVVLEARNPQDGIYAYRLTAFPVGATEGQYAGVERLNIYEPARRDRLDWP
ncbi:MAG: DUF2808 domain-containing protein [Cyanobacteria bacterium J06649_4]